jgi:ribonuclease P protein component
MGKSVVRNRMKRRMREAVRLELANLPAWWAIVFNPRKPVLDVEFESLRREVERLFTRCRNS